MRAYGISRFYPRRPSFLVSRPPACLAVASVFDPFAMDDELRKGVFVLSNLHLNMVSFCENHTPDERSGFARGKE